MWLVSCSIQSRVSIIVTGNNWCSCNLYNHITQLTSHCLISKIHFFLLHLLFPHSLLWLQAPFSSTITSSSSTSTISRFPLQHVHQVHSATAFPRLTFIATCPRVHSTQSAAFFLSSLKHHSSDNHLQPHSLCRWHCANKTHELNSSISQVHLFQYSYT